MENALHYFPVASTSLWVIRQTPGSSAHGLVFLACLPFQNRTVILLSIQKAVSRQGITEFFSSFPMEDNGKRSKIHSTEPWVIFFSVIFKDDAQCVNMAHN